MGDRELREASRRRFDRPGGKSTFEEINTGSLQRIADAVEVMSRNHQALIDQRDQLRQWYRDELARRLAADRSRAALRGQITKLRKQLEARNAE